MTSKTWFNVDKEGLRALQAGKSKTFVINELVQNAWDENITTCKLNIEHQGNELIISVEDDNPEGFKDISHAYTLFADTYKRTDPTKRGRFNLGEKQVLSICNKAEVSTTKGTITFDDEGRKKLKRKRDKGSKITIWIEGTNKDAVELIAHAKKLLVPTHINYYVNDEKVTSKIMIHVFEASLDTEILRDGAMVTTSRKSNVHLVEPIGQPYIYEMGIPIVETDCHWSIDIQQKIPLAVDRETIRPYYLQDLYAVIINNAHRLIKPNHASDLWVRTGMKDERCKKIAIAHIMKKRFGEKFLSANPFDPNANDKALSKGYNIIHGSEMSKEEWERLRELGLIESSTSKFGTKGLVSVEALAPTDAQKRFAKLSKRIAKQMLGVDITVRFVNVDNQIRACYENEDHLLIYNIGNRTVGKHFFDKLTWENLRLLIHELGHQKGNHTEMQYHYCLTELGGKLIMMALENPNFFEKEAY